MAFTAQMKLLEKMDSLLDALTVRENPILQRLRQDRAAVLEGMNMRPDPWQRDLLLSRSQRVLMLCCRQSGKSLTASAIALVSALLDAPALILIISRAQRQSSELFKDKFLPLYNALGRPVPAVQQSALSLELANGSRVICLPGKEETIRGYSGVKLLIVDEAARVPDALYYSVRPMLAVSRGRIICLTTPFGKRGWFYEAWTGKANWKRIKITANECPRITPEFLEEERRSMGDRWYKQEYEVSFEDAEGAVFASDDIQAALCEDIVPLF